METEERLKPNGELRKAIKAAGYPRLVDFARALDVHEKQVDRWVNESRIPHRETRKRIARKVGRKVADLWP